VYAYARQWVMSRLVRRERLTTERMFEHLYRLAREVQTRPSDAGVRLGLLLRELFDPLDVQSATLHAVQSRVSGEGENLVVPLPGVAGAPSGTLVLAFADRGRRLFSNDDARLADRIVDLVTRSLAVDQAVERGRSEERERIAQDLHDDIGARLLTLMYQAPTVEMEDYLRHTLKELKTLTRGLAAPSHWLSHAVAEWKADISQRLAAADCDLGWTFTFVEDFELNVVQWSALTRILRELVSNAIVHARASRVDIEASIEGGELRLRVADNGDGGDPADWSHGLGIGGVRKRVKQLGGEVRWSRSEPCGITCFVVARGFGPPHPEGRTGGLPPP
jgi:signal transduction histidine kinase